MPRVLTLIPSLAVAASVTGALSAGDAPTPAPTDPASLAGLRDALVGGTPNVFLRARMESVDSDAFDDDATAYTLRSAVGYTTRPWFGLSASAQFEGVFALGETDYNSQANGKTTYPVIADHTQTVELQQAWLRYAPGFVPGAALTGGRQEINLDNQRWVGAVGWRQDWQSFDAVSAMYRPAKGPLAQIEFFYAYLDDVHRIAPETIATGDVDMDSHLVNAAWKPADWLRLTGYAYLLDFDTRAGQAAFLAQSTSTLGARATGAVKLADPWTVMYTAEYAQQTDYAENPVDVDASYLLLEAGAAWKGLGVRLGYEVLSGDASTPGDKLTTPLATLHAFNGWADQFLATPNAGLVDAFVGVGGPIPGAKGLRAWIWYHDFSQDDGSDRYGDELDLQVEMPLQPWFPGALVGAKYAAYTADEGEGALIPGSAINVDVTKFWVYAQFAF